MAGHAGLADLIGHVDRLVGLGNTLIVLSADHGGPETPEYMAGLGMETGRLTPQRVDEEPIIFAGADRPAQRISRITHPVDSAPTLSNHLGIKPPAGSVGVPLYEVWSGHTEETPPVVGEAALLAPPYPPAPEAGTGALRLTR
jgi:arylsulfatase A-like enzyme